MTVIKMFSSPDRAGEKPHNTPESDGEKKYINFFTDAVFILGIFNAITTAVASIVLLGAMIYHVVIKVNNMEPLPTDIRCIIMLLAFNIVAFLFTVDLLRSVGKVQTRRLIWSTLITVLVTLAGMTTTFVYLAFVGVVTTVFWQGFGVIYSLLFIMVLLGLVYTKPRTDQELETDGPSGFGDINKLLVQNFEQTKKSGLEII